MDTKLSYKFSYRRRLPHIQPKGSTFFVTTRLAGSLPVEVVDRLMLERKRINRELEKIEDAKQGAARAFLESSKLFDIWDKELDNSTTGINYLADRRIADMVAESLHFRDGHMFELIAFCIMPNHLHIIFTPLEESNEKNFSLAKIMHSFKRHTAREANSILGRNGAFWQHENYDHFVRDEKELERIIKYVLQNPVKANLVTEQADWKWSYSKYEM